MGVGLGVMAELMEEEVDDVVGLKGKHDPDRIAVRHGHESGEVTLGGRRVAVERPRVRTADGSEEVKIPIGRTVTLRPSESRACSVSPSTTLVTVAECAAWAFAADGSKRARAAAASSTAARKPVFTLSLPAPLVDH